MHEHLLRTKIVGEWAEAFFLQCALRHGFGAYKAWGDSGPADIVVSHLRRLSRVQVRCTIDCRDYPNRCCTSLRHGNTRRFFTRDEIDFLAAYIGPQGAWYILPLRVIANLYNVTLKPDNQFARYREAWRLMESRARPLSAVTVSTPSLIAVSPFGRPASWGVGR